MNPVGSMGKFAHQQILLILLSISFLAAQPLLAAPPSAELEVLQAHATLLYHSKKYEECIATLKKAMALDPNNINALELLALNQRQLKQDNQAAETYTKLLRFGPTEKKPAYRFELGTIRYQQKDLPHARRHFELAARGNFNPGTSHFFLGVMDFNAKRWRKARHHLTSALTHSDAKPMTPVTRFYLASTYVQLGKTDAAIINFNEARQELTTQDSSAINSLADEIRKNALKELESYDKGSPFASLTLLSQWDSNVQTNPSEVSNAVASSSQRSLKAVLSGVAGYSTSPVQTFQITPSYRFFTNYNFHYLATDYNFISHTPSVYALYKPYTRLSAGIKTEATFSMKNMLQTDDDRRALKYRKYSLSGDLGLVSKFELTPRILLSGEVTYRPKKFYLDAATGDSRRTGHGLYSRVSSEFLSEYTFFTPTLYATFEWDNTAGKTFRSRAWGTGISNPVAVNSKLTITGSLDLLSTDYYEIKSPKRDDFMTSFRVAGSYSIDSNWTALADAGYIDNHSNQTTTYKYNRFILSAGATYSF